MRYDVWRTGTGTPSAAAAAAAAAFAVIVTVTVTVTVAAGPLDANQATETGKETAVVGSRVQDINGGQGDGRTMGRGGRHEVGAREPKDKVRGCGRGDGYDGDGDVDGNGDREMCVTLSDWQYNHPPPRAEMED
jgi:hypothetical protein